MHSNNKLTVLPCFLLVVAVLIPVIGGASSLADANSNVDVRVPQDPIPPPGLVSCCIPKGQNCDESTCQHCCSKDKIETTCYQCGKESKTPATAQCPAPSLVVKTKPACCIPDGFSCDIKSTCGSCCSGQTISKYACLKCA